MAKKAGKSPKRSSPRAAVRRRATSTKRQAGATRKRTTRTAPARKRPAAKTARKASKPANKAKKRPLPAKKAAPAPRKRLKKAPKAATRKVAAPKRTTAAKRQRPASDADTKRPVHPLSLDRNRRHLPELEDNVPTPPSSLDLDRTPSAARSGRLGMASERLQHNETSPELTGGDVDANWENAYAVGDESPGGDNPTPDQDRVDDIGKALGVQYNDDEELKASDKITERDRHRWELDPASAEDYPEHDE